MELANRRVIVVGLGKSGVAAVRLCLAHGAVVIGTDAAPLERLSPEARALASEARCSLLAGGHDAVRFDEADLVLVSPGVPPLAAVAAAEARGVAVSSELDFAWDLCREVPTVAVGGTNGKSTTTTLVAEILAADGRRTFAGGNLGTPLAEVAPGPGEHAKDRWDALVLEVSSFQAERMPTFHPKAATLLNVTADHLDRYPSLEAYGDAKGNMLVHMGAGDLVVIPEGDPLTARQAARSRARVVTFGPTAHVRIEPGAIVDGVFGRTYPRAEIRLTGDHNALNVAASVVLAAALGASEDATRRTLSTFAGLAHRIALVEEIDGVRYYDDSKGTNVGASVAALRGLAEPRAVLIAGGRDKLGAYEPLAHALRDRGRAVVVIGEAAARIAEATRPFVETVSASDMDDAVAKARALAKPGDAVLLSPACSSFDMFRDYKHRGDEFVRAVRALPGARRSP